jgi:hypothetical protein
MQPTFAGPAVPIRARCGCGGARTLPVWLVSDTLVTLRQQLNGTLKPDDPVMTYRCRHCKQIVILTASEVYLSDSKGH